MSNAIKIENERQSATAASSYAVVDCKYIKLLKNDGATAINFGFDNPVSSGNALKLKAGESLENIEIGFLHSLYYIADDANDNYFRFIGLR